MSADEIQQLSRPEKLRLMEALWADLSQDENKLESPEWPGEVLQATVGCLDRGEESLPDWSHAKAKLRQLS